ncbi:hypothetical protein ROT00_10120 [Agromyces mediolanus]|uniref:hypothetical protein n=1 Tax=Agromyces mediolanus TaxID=41986 RepID=UPI003839B043
MTSWFLAELLGWIVLALALGAATAFSMLAYWKPRRLHLWLAAGALAVALVAAATLPGPAPLGIGVLTSAAAILVAVFGGGPAASVALDLAMGGSVRQGLHGGILVDAKHGDAADGVRPAQREVLRGGRTIGVLERLATAGAIVAGFPEALAIVVAVKGVGRFTELEAPEARERFIIGTLASLIWAAGAGLVAHLVLR